MLLGVLSAGLIVVLVIGFFSWQHQRDIDKAHAGALKAAKAFALDFGAYDYRTLDADFKKVTKGMTASFAKDYSDTSSKLKPTLVQYKTHVTASIQGAGVTVGGTAKATVVVFLDQMVSTSQSTRAAAGPQPPADATGAPRREVAGGDAAREVRAARCLVDVLPIT